MSKVFSRSYHYLCYVVYIQYICFLRYNKVVNLTIFFPQRFRFSIAWITNRNHQWAGLNLINWTARYCTCTCKLLSQCTPTFLILFKILRKLWKQLLNLVYYPLLTSQWSSQKLPLHLSASYKIYVTVSQSHRPICNHRKIRSFYFVKSIAIFYIFLPNVKFDECSWDLTEVLGIAIFILF